MRTERNYHPRIEMEVNKVLTSEGLKPLSPLSHALEEGENNYATLAIDSSGRRVFFKISLIESPGQSSSLQIFPPRKLESEIAVYELLGAVANQDKNFITPRYLKGKRGNPSWLVLEELTPKIVWGFDHQFITASMEEDYIEMIVNGVLSYQQTLSNRGFLFFDTTNTPAISGYFERNRQWIASHLGQEGSLATKGFLLDNLSLWSKHRTRLAHGDLSFHNLGFLDRKLVVFDWEHAHINHPVYDFAKVYAQAWLYPDWRRKLAIRIQQEFASAEFETLFRTAIVVRCLSEITHLGLCLENEEYGYSRKLCEVLPRDRQVAIFSQAVFSHEQTILNILDGTSL